MKIGLRRILKNPLATVLAFALSTAPLAAPAAGAEIQTIGSSGVRAYMTEMSAGTVWSGDTGETPAEKQQYWQLDGSTVYQVAATYNRVAWAEFYDGWDPFAPPVAGPLTNRVLIGQVADTAGDVVTVEIGAPVLGLAADPSNDRFYAATPDSIVTFKEDGSALQTVLTDSQLVGVETALAIDPVNHFLYATISTGDIFNRRSSVVKYPLDATNLVGGAAVTLHTDLPPLDGIGIDIETQTVYVSTYSGNGVIRHFAASGEGSVTTMDWTQPSGCCASGMAIDSAADKIYFTTETSVYELAMDGSSSRTLYSTSAESYGFSAIALVFPEQLSVDSVTPNAGSELGGQEITISGGGFDEAATVTVGGKNCPIISRTDSELVCTTPSNEPGVVDVVVTNGDSTSVTLESAYTYESAFDSRSVSVTIAFIGTSSKLSTGAKKQLAKLVAKVPSNAVNVNIVLTATYAKKGNTARNLKVAKARGKSVLTRLQALGQDGDWSLRTPKANTGTTTKHRLVKVTIKFEVPIG